MDESSTNKADNPSLSKRFSGYYLSLVCTCMLQYHTTSLVHVLVEYILIISLSFYHAILSFGVHKHSFDNHLLAKTILKFKFGFKKCDLGFAIQTILVT